MTDRVRLEDGTIIEVESIRTYKPGASWRYRDGVWEERGQVNVGAAFSTRSPSRYQMSKKGSPTRAQARKRLLDIGMHPYPEDVEQVQKQARMTERDKATHAERVAESMVGGLDKEVEGRVESEDVRKWDPERDQKQE